MLKNNILTLSDPWDTHWKLSLNLDAIIKDTGRREKNTTTNKVETLFPISNAKKLIKLILQYASDDELSRIDILFRGNEKLYKVWKEYYL